MSSLEIHAQLAAAVAAYRAQHRLVRDLEHGLQARRDAAVAAGLFELVKRGELVRSGGAPREVRAYVVSIDGLTRARAELRALHRTADDLALLVAGLPTRAGDPLPEERS